MLHTTYITPCLTNLVDNISARIYVYQDTPLGMNRWVFDQQEQPDFDLISNNIMQIIITITYKHFWCLTITYLRLKSPPPINHAPMRRLFWVLLQLFLPQAVRIAILMSKCTASYVVRKAQYTMR